MKITIVNVSDHAISILWDESALVLPDGASERIIHTGVRYIESAKPQAPTTIAPHSSTVEVIWPVGHIYAASRTGIKIFPGGLVKLYLAWQEQEKRKGAQWSWQFQRAKPVARPGPRHMFGLSFPTIGTLHYDDQGNLRSITGFNIGLGYSARTYTAKDGLQPNRFNGYWGWGTVAFIVPYVEFGVSYPFELASGSQYFVIDIGMIYIAPYIEFSIYY